MPDHEVSCVLSQFINGSLRWTRVYMQPAAVRSVACVCGREVTLTRFLLIVDYLRARVARFKLGAHFLDV